MADEGGQFLYTIRPRRIEMLSSGPTPAEAQVIDEHSNYLKGLAEAGVVRLAGRTQNADETTFGIVVLNVSDEASARAVMERDPFVKSGLMIATLFPFRVAYAAK